MSPFVAAIKFLLEQTTKNSEPAVAHQARNFETAIDSEVAAYQQTAQEQHNLTPEAPLAGEPGPVSQE